MTIEELKNLRESEDKVEFKAAEHNFPWNGGSHTDQRERRKCYLGYIVALANEGGGRLVLGMSDNHPHEVVGSDFAQGKIGELEDAVYGHLAIRVHIEELFEDGKRVVLTTIPSRPLGRLMKFEGVALMRTGESLRNMSDDEMFKILSEQEPDFSAKICPDFTLEGIDQTALNTLKEKYARKQGNDAFRQLSNEQVLRDLDLMVNDSLTYAALILVGKKELIKDKLPNAQVNIEYRSNLSKTEYDNREVILEPLFTGIDKIWTEVNTRKGATSFSEGPYQHEIPWYNEQVIREAVLNAIAHRDYTTQSETVIKQYPARITIINAGGFPKGVDKENLISVSSTPRSRLLADVLQKTGLVERSGQGVDKIFRITLSEGKPWPDYSKTDPFQVELTIIGEVEDKAFAAFIEEEQNKRTDENKLGTADIVGLRQIKDGKREKVDDNVIQKLEESELIKRSGGNASDTYVLGNAYYEVSNQPAEIGGFRTVDLKRILSAFGDGESCKMSAFVSVLEGDYNRGQVKYLIDKLVEKNVLTKSGSGSGTTYTPKGGIKSIEDVTMALIDG